MVNSDYIVAGLYWFPQKPLFHSVHPKLISCVGDNITISQHELHNLRLLLAKHHPFGLKLLSWYLIATAARL